VWALVRRHVEAVETPPLGAAVAPGAPYVDPVLRGPHVRDEASLDAPEARSAAMLPPRYRDASVSPAPMAAAPLEVGPDGAVAWDRGPRARRPIGPVIGRVGAGPAGGLPSTPGPGSPRQRDPGGPGWAARRGPRRPPRSRPTA